MPAASVTRCVGPLACTSLCAVPVRCVGRASAMCLSYVRRHVAKQHSALLPSSMFCKECFLGHSRSSRRAWRAQVVPLYCFDPRQYALTPFGNPKTGAHRAQFLLESVLDLKASLRSIGSDLLIHLGRPEDVMSGACVAPAGAGSACTHAAQAYHLRIWRPAPSMAVPPVRTPSPALVLCTPQQPGCSGCLAPSMSWPALRGRPLPRAGGRQRQRRRRRAGARPGTGRGDQRGGARGAGRAARRAQPRPAGTPCTRLAPARPAAACMPSRSPQCLSWACTHARARLRPARVST